MRGAQWLRDLDTTDGYFNYADQRPFLTFAGTRTASAT